MALDEVVAYTYCADLYCPACILRHLPTGPGERFDGWADVSVPPMDAEANLTELAAAFGIDRNREETYDSGEFPKVVFPDMLESGDRCGDCGDLLGDYDDMGRCPACGSPIDYCQGHGEMGDPEGARVLAAHDAGDHTDCHPEGCDEARN